MTPVRGVAWEHQQALPQVSVARDLSRTHHTPQVTSGGGANHYNLSSMPGRHEIRTLAMQLLYQLDLREGDQEQVLPSLTDEAGPVALRDEAWALAVTAWEHHAAADEAVSPLSPDWPTSRQPPLDRAILRLAYTEMVTGHAPHRVVINEAIELAKAFCSEQSPAFVNGILDKLAQQLPELPEASEVPGPVQPNDDPWLADALKHSVEETSTDDVPSSPTPESPLPTPEKS